jgi:hypothetical protein
MLTSKRLLDDFVGVSEKDTLALLSVPKTASDFIKRQNASLA